MNDPQALWSPFRLPLRIDSAQCKLKRFREPPFKQSIQMLMRYGASNYRSLAERQELSLVASSADDLPGVTVEVPGYDEQLLRVAAIYGPNASGKTNVLRAFSFICDAVMDSQRKWAPDGQIPRQRFLLNESLKNSVSTFDVDFVVDGTRFHYGFALDSARIQEEWLHAFPNARKQVWFARQGQSFRFGKHLTGENKTIENLTRTNSLFLSAAVQNNHEQLMPLYRWFRSVRYLGERNRNSLLHTTADACADEASRSAILRFLAASDLGIVDLQIKREPWDEDAKQLFASIQKVMSAHLKAKRSLETPGQRVRVSLRHKTSNPKRSVLFPLQRESAGTQALFGLLGPAIHALSVGSVLLVDELDASLHPVMALTLVKLFNNRASNAKGAQLVFNTHDTNLLDTEVLRRDQIWFTEKDGTGATRLYPLSDFKPRRQENLERGYLQGRYGAIPFVDRLMIDKSPGDVAKKS